MVHGLLEDPADEFFITRTEDTPAGGGRRSSSGAEQQAETQEGSDSSVYYDWHHGYKVRPLRRVPRACVAHAWLCVQMYSSVGAAPLAGVYAFTRMLLG
jgi:hypothetical protein